MSTGQKMFPRLAILIVLFTHSPSTIIEMGIARKMAKTISMPKTSLPAKRNNALIYSFRKQQLNMLIFFERFCNDVDQKFHHHFVKNIGPFYCTRKANIITQ